MQHRRRFIVCGARPEFVLDADWADKYYIPARMVAAMRPGDVTVLPGGSETLREFVGLVEEALGLAADQVLWTSGENYLLDADVEQELLPRLRELLGDGEGWEILPYGVHWQFRRWAGEFPRAAVLGDEEGWVERHATKAILHPSIGTVTVNGAGILAGVPGLLVARGYSCRSVEELVEAARQLAHDGDGAGFVVKPALGATGEGIEFVSSTEELRRYSFPMGPVVLEERLLVDRDAAGRLVAPSIQFFGQHLLGEPLDQIIEGTAFAGNAYPAGVSASFGEELVSAARAALAVLRPKGPGGFDFLSVGGHPVLVDPNLGRLTGAHPVRMFVRHRAPDARAFLSWKVHDEKIGVRDFWERLRRRSAAFDGRRGVFPLCYLPGMWSMLLAAGGARKEVEQLRAEAEECLG